MNMNLEYSKITGVLTLVQMDIPIEDWCEQQCIKMDLVKHRKFYDSWLECFYDYAFYDYILLDGKLWKNSVINDSPVDLYDCKIKRNPDGTMTYEAFYSGPTDLAVEKIIVSTYNNEMK